MEKEIKYYKQMCFGSRDDGSTVMMGRDSEDEPWKTLTVIKATEEKKKKPFWKRMLTMFIS